jgi:outer membrane receptor for ferrienterochelin and colicins
VEWIGLYQLPMELPLVFQWSYNYHDQNSYYGTTPFMAKQHIGFGQ